MTGGVDDPVTWEGVDDQGTNDRGGGANDRTVHL